MACHFSSYGTGLSNCPEALPPHAMVILNDRTPLSGHDPAQVAAELAALTERLEAAALLLDLQRPVTREGLAIVRAVTAGAVCPVGVAAPYAEGLSCGVFLPPPPLHIPLSRYLAPWQGRELWLEAALGSQVLTLTPEGCRIAPPAPGVPTDTCHSDATLHCRYRVELGQQEAVFTLYRSREDLAALLAEAEKAGVTLAVGLYQELGNM